MRGLTRPRTVRLAASGWSLALLLARVAFGASLTVTAPSAHIGGYGLEVTVGAQCSSPDTVVVPPGQVQGSFEACLSLSASDVEISGSGATFRTGQTIVFGDGFIVPDGVTFTAELDLDLSTDFASVDDPSPISETVYNATFYVRLDDLSLTDGDAIEHLAAISDSGESQFALTVRKDLAGTTALHLGARQDGGGWVQMTPGQELPLASGWNKIDLAWSSADGTGHLLVGINGSPLTGLTGLSNLDSTVESIRWGAIDGVLTTTTGALQLDGFDSWR